MRPMVQKSGVIDGTIPTMPSPSKSQAPSKSSAKGKAKVAKASPQQERIDRLRAMMVLAQTPLLPAADPRSFYLGLAISTAVTIAATVLPLRAGFRAFERMEAA